MRAGQSMAAAGRTTLADKSGGRSPVETLNDDGPAIFANSQDDWDTPAAHLIGWCGRFFKRVPEAPEESPQDLHADSMNQIAWGCNHPQLSEKEIFPAAAGRPLAVEIG